MASYHVLTPVMQSALLHFQSDAFTVTPGEDQQTNPGIFGRALAEWVGDRLREQNLPEAEPRCS